MILLQSLIDTSNLILQVQLPSHLLSWLSFHSLHDLNAYGTPSEARREAATVEIMMTKYLKIKQQQYFHGADFAPGSVLGHLQIGANPYNFTTFIITSRGN